MLHKREEGTEVPEGASLTETDIAWYVRFRKDDRIVTIRQSKTMQPPPLIEYTRAGDK